MNYSNVYTEWQAGDVFNWSMFMTDYEQINLYDICFDKLQRNVTSLLAKTSPIEALTRSAMG